MNLILGPVLSHVLGMFGCFGDVWGCLGELKSSIRTLGHHQGWDVLGLTPSDATNEMQFEWPANGRWADHWYGPDHANWHKGRIQHQMLLCWHILTSVYEKLLPPLPSPFAAPGEREPNLILFWKWSPVSCWMSHQRQAAPIPSTRPKMLPGFFPIPSIVAEIKKFEKNSTSLHNWVAEEFCNQENC